MSTETTHTSQNSNVEIGKKFFKLRDYTPIPLIIILFFVAKPTVLSATLGMFFIFFGELFRIYSVAFIGTVSRTRSDSTGQKLISSGPFSWVRNPLYVANFFIVLGVTVFGGQNWLVILTVILFAIQYHFVVQYEQANLTEKFGDEYRQYLKDVPAWFPRRVPKLSEIQWPDNFSPALKSEKRTLSAIIAILVILLIVSKS